MKVHELIDRLIELNQPDAEILIEEPCVTCEPVIFSSYNGKFYIQGGDIVKDE
jgi:hypothetical protein